MALMVLLDDDPLLQKQHERSPLCSAGRNGGGGGLGPSDAVPPWTACAPGRWADSLLPVGGNSVTGFV